MKKLYFTVLLIMQTLFYINAQTLEIEVSADKTDILTCEAINYTLKYKSASAATNLVGAKMTASVTSGVVFSSNQKLELPSDIASYSISSDLHSVTFIFKESIIAGKSGIIKLTGKAECEKPEGTIATFTGTILSGGIPKSTAKVMTILHSDKKYMPKNGSDNNFDLESYLNKASNQSDFTIVKEKNITSNINESISSAKTVTTKVSTSSNNTKNNAEAKLAATCVTILNSSTNGSTVTDCDCIFLDSGDSTSNYGINENYTIHFCSNDPTKKVQIDFSEFSTELYYDRLRLYDGADATAYQIGVYSGTNSPGIVVSTGSCLTITWNSD
ncbi:MAG: CUB domain-containing protein, partial [Saprospiraceae bacterium]|nr:CUB domain-containing protein [Saprospiraceae bacterium]